MATLIDALYVTLGLDTKGYTEGARKAQEARRKFGQAEEKADKERIDRQKKFGEALKTTERHAVGLFATLTASAGIANFATKMTLTDASTGRLAKNLGMATEQLSLWQGAVKQVGGTAEEVAGSMQALSDIQTRAKLGIPVDPGALGAMAQFGLQVSDLADKQQTLLKINQAINDRKIDPQRAQALGGMLGLSSGTMTLLQRSPVELQKYLADQRKAGVITDKQATDAQEAQRQASLARSTATNAGNEVLDRVLPGATVAMEKMTALMQAFPAATQGIIALTAVLSLAKTVGVARGVLGAVTGLGGAGAGAGAAAGAGAIGTAAAAAGLLTVDAFLAREVFRSNTGAGAQGEKGQLAVHQRYMGLFRDFARRAGRDPTREEAQRLRGAAEQGFSAKPGEQRVATASPAGPSRAPAAGVFAAMRRKAGLNGSRNMFSQLEAERHLPSGLLDSVWQQESARGRHMRSAAGARGHFQFMPGTAQRFGLRDPNDLEQSATAASRYLAILLKLFSGDTRKALAGYNWGEGHVVQAVRRWGEAWEQHLPKETRNYVASITSRMTAAARSQAGGSSVTSTTNIQSLQLVLPNVRDARDGNAILNSTASAMRRRGGLAAQANSGLV